MIEFVEKFISENNLKGKVILTGLSGGVDSSVLCYILSKIKDIKTIAIHLNHNWRGADSKRDEEFARNSANSAGLEFYSETLPDTVKKTETCAREARYLFFENCKKKFNANAVFLAHNKNDSIETLIYRLIKGTGPSGLNSIPKIREFYYRPLLEFSREEIENFAQENNIRYITDKSNFDTKYKRNLIREKIIPLMEEINPCAINSISNFIKLNKMRQNIIDNVIFETKKRIFKNGKIKRSEFLKLNSEIQFEIINCYLKNILKTRDFKTITRIVNFILKNNSSKISINKNLFLKIYKDEIYLIGSQNKNTENIEKKLKEGKNEFLNYILEIKKIKTPSTFSDNKFISLDFKNNDYILRTRRQEDIICPFGSSGFQKLKTYLIKKKVPVELRNEIPLIAVNNEVLYVPDTGISEKIKVDKKDEKCYKITVKRKQDE